MSEPRPTAHYHLPGLFEFYDFYRVFLPLFRRHRSYFYDWCDIGSIYGAPADCHLGRRARRLRGRTTPREVLALMQEYGISARLTFSNSLLRAEHLADPAVQRALPAVCCKRRRAKRRDRPLGAAAGLPAAEHTRRSTSSPPPQRY